MGSIHFVPLKVWDVPIQLTVAHFKMVQGQSERPYSSSDMALEVFAEKSAMSYI